MLSPKILSSPYLWGAHHPHCPRFNNHLLWIWGHPFCLGCSFFYCGAAIGSIFAFLNDWGHYSFLHWTVFHAVFLLMTIFQPWLQYKLYKSFSRWYLGFGVSSFAISGIFFVNFLPALAKILIAPFVLVSYKFFNQIRNRYTKNPCSDCAEGTYPTCKWNLPSLLINNPEETKLLEDAIKKPDLTR